MAALLLKTTTAHDGARVERNLAGNGVQNYDPKERENPQFCCARVTLVENVG